MKPIIALLLSILLTMIIGFYGIPVLREKKKKFIRKNHGKRIIRDMDAIPEMGGLIPAISVSIIFVITVFLSFIYTDYPDSLFLYIIVFGIIVAFTILGSFFDYLKITKKENNLKIGFKTLITMLLSALSLYGVIYLANIKPEIRMLDGTLITVKRSVKLILDIFVFVYVINAMSKTTKIQGLTTSLGIMITVFLAGLSLRVLGTTNGLILSTITGSLIGFLLFSWPNAKAKIGNVGSYLISSAIAVSIVFLSLEIFVPLLLIMPTIDYIFQLKTEKIRKDKKNIYIRKTLSHILLKKNLSLEVVNIIYIGITFFACLITYHAL